MGWSSSLEKKKSGRESWFLIGRPHVQFYEDFDWLETRVPWKGNPARGVIVPSTTRQQDF